MRPGSPKSHAGERENEDVVDGHGNKNATNNLNRETLDNQGTKKIPDEDATSCTSSTTSNVDELDERSMPYSEDQLDQANREAVKTMALNITHHTTDELDGTYL